MGMKGNHENFPLVMESVETLSPQLAGGKAGERRQQCVLPYTFPAACHDIPCKMGVLLAGGVGQKKVCNGIAQTGIAYVFLSWSKS